MGKATILPDGARNLARGQYRIRLEKDDTRIQTDLKRLDTDIDAAQSLTPERFVEYENAQKAYESAKLDLDQIIQQSKESPEEDFSNRLVSATNARNTAEIARNVAKSRYQSVRLKQRALEGKKLYLTNKVTEDIRIVWCADCQTSLSGTVATVEIPNTDDTVLIRPGGADGTGATYSATRDGQLRSVSSMSSAEAAWNYTLFPAWQKWKPLYRLGKITERVPGNSKCSVLLDAYSTVQSLDTDVERRLTNVPMVYKGRDDGGPYVVGDRVLVEFYNQNQEAPRVVGFEQDPCTTSSSTTTTTAIPSITFYIRFKLNSCTPDHSGYEIKLTYGDSEVLYGYSHDSDKELVGPFTIEGGYDPYAYVRNRWMYYSPWEPNTSYTAGETPASYIRLRTANSEQAISYKCIQSGVSGGTEPSWPLDETVVTDGTVRWECQGVDNTGFDFFWFYTQTTSDDPEAIRRDVIIETHVQDGINHNYLATPSDGSFYLKPLYYKRHPTTVLNTTKTTEEIGGEEVDVYNIDFTDIKRMRASIAGQRYSPCLLGEVSELTSDGLDFDEINIIGSGYSRWAEELATLPRTSDSTPNWVPAIYEYPHPGIICEIICGDIALRAYFGSGSPGYQAFYCYGVNSIATIDVGADIDHTYCILTDEHGCAPSYPGLELVLDVGRYGTHYLDKEREGEPCVVDLYSDNTTTQYNSVATITVVMESIPCGEFVPESYRP